MRNKFSELINQEVAPFYHEPIAPEVPCPCPICRAYNALWGTLTDTHMSPSGSGYVITGTFVNDPKSWEKLLYALNWGGCRFDTNWTTLSEFLACYNLCWEYSAVNGQSAIKLASCEQSTPTTECRTYRTADSRFSQPVAQLGRPWALAKCFENNTMEEVAKAMNESSEVVGSHWHVHAGTIVGSIKDKVVIFEHETIN